MKLITHSMGAAAVWAAGCALAHPAAAAAVGGVLAAAGAAPLPDLDNLGAWGRRRPGWIRWRIHPVKYRAAQVLSVFGTHRRGPAHSLAGTLLLAATFTVPAAWWLWWPLWLPAAVLAGLWSHLALDLANCRPVALLWPLPVLVHGLPSVLRCRVGGWGETAWRAALTTALVISIAHWSIPPCHLTCT